MMVPIVWALARQYPDIRITVLSRPVSRTFFEDLAPNVNFMAADIKGEYHGVKGLNALFRRLVAKQFTHIADLHNVLRSEYLRLRFNMGSYCVEHIDKHRKMRKRLTARDSKKNMKPLPTSFDNYLEVFEHLGFPVDINKYHFHSYFAEGKGNLNLLPREIGPKRQWEQWIGIAPFAAHRGKIYPTDKMEEVIKMLISKYPKIRIFLFGRGAKEEKYFEKWTESMPVCVHVTKCLENMYQELILMSHLDVMVSMDSANMHMASMTATPVVSIWGATHPYAGFMGWGQSEENAVQLDLPCRPCSIFGNKPCRRGDYQCLEGIIPDMIFEKINRILTKNQAQEV
jgi:ADP-heptose:LPS heptosyltransferase